MNDDSSIPPDDNPTFETIMSALQDGDISTEQGTIRWSSNYTFLVDVVHDGLTFPAVYKPQGGERPLWDFPDGTLCFRERAAFLTSEALGWRLVPPTVLRDGSRGLGSVQFFIDHDPEHHYFTFDASFKPQLMKLALFDAVINNADRKGGHCIADADNRLWGIDHGIAFNAQNKLRTVIWNFAGQPIAADDLRDLAALCEKLDAPDDPYTGQMSQLINGAEMLSLKRRIRLLIDSACYPSPGPGPNYPWPPV